MENRPVLQGWLAEIEMIRNLEFSHVGRRDPFQLSIRLRQW